MNINKYIGLAALALPLTAAAQKINFESDGEVKQIGVYDSWEASPFRTGKLEGNVAVVKNHLNEVDEVLGAPINPSGKILGVQRSRFGSNTFGARIDLKETFELTPETKYVHVLMHKPVEGRVMLIGLGKRRDRAGQSAEAEQFWAFSTRTLKPGKWGDAVFPVKGNGGIDIHSIVVVPEAESPHLRTEDFACYIDSIEVNEVSTPRVFDGVYPLNFDEAQVSGKAGNFLRYVELNGSADGDQRLTLGSLSPQLIYRDNLDFAFKAKAGEKLTPNFSFSSGWMNGYVYLDRGRDGKFTADLNDDYTIPEGSDIMTYSYVETIENTEGYKSDGSKVTGNDRNFLNPPAFKLPEDLAPGFYRMRFKVDWGSVDPAGRMTESNSIVSNGGNVVDALMNVHGETVKISRSGGLNGDIMLEDGSKLESVTHGFGKPFTIVSNPAPDFELDYVVVRHGYNLSGDSLLHETPQWFEQKISALLFRDGKYTIPAELIDGDVMITPEFINPGVKPEPDKEDYALNFDGKTLEVTRTDRRLNNFTVTTGGTKNTRIAVPTGSKLVYRDLLGKQVPASGGDEISAEVSYTGNAMHVYLYVDLNEDGRFNVALDANGRPMVSSELLSYTCYDGKNSLGEKVSPTTSNWTLPAFKLPVGLPLGSYRARLKVDWNNIDPKGQWSKGGENNIDDNGGQVVDFLLNVHNESHELKVFTRNGSINGASNTGLPLTVTPFTSLAIVPTPVAPGYVSEGVVVKHGHRFDGPQYVRGNRQWSEYVTRSTGSITLPKDTVNGDVILTALYEPTDAAAYKLVFSDEFEDADGTLPSADKWMRCPRLTSTWNRWLSKTEAQHALTGYIEDGNFVARALPNPDKTSDNVDMITGGIKSMGKFGFKYGKVEGRLRTHKHTGNFPAFWMMPEDQSAGWPKCGEIDIWEQINNEDRAYHTVHTNWTYNLGNKTGSSFNESVQMDRYHTYGFEWNEKMVRWFVDGKQVGAYSKSTNEDALSKGQWPFDKDFHLILNQSVGDGSWAHRADINHTYVTLFDWVRVYQKDGQTNTGIVNAAVSPAFEISLRPGVLRILTEQAARITVTDLQARVLYSGIVEGQADVPLQRGVYIVNEKKVLVP